MKGGGGCTNFCKEVRISSVCMYVFVCARACACVRACVRVCVCMCACVRCVCVRVRVVCSAVRDGGGRVVAEQRKRQVLDLLGVVVLTLVLYHESKRGYEMSGVCIIQRSFALQCVYVSRCE